MLKKLHINTANYCKSMTKNKFKRVMVCKPNERIINFISDVKMKRKLEGINILDVGYGEDFISRLVKDRIKDNQIVVIEYSIEELEIAQKLDPDIKFY